MAKILTLDTEKEIKSDFIEILKEKYLSYALSTITDRALPDVRDGLKPVHRRLLFAMSELKLGSANTFKKCARVVGDVIGKYHPHGEQAVYDSLVKLAQDFSHRYPLIEGQGNFGNVDGDNAAAMRYTESRLTRISELIMDQMYDGTIEFSANYDESEIEPKVFPSAFPNLLANGTSGIAVGMATNIPPHNILEILEIAMLILEEPNIQFDKIMEHFKGPDFPTGGVIINSRNEIIEIYKKGRGVIKLRCKWKEVQDNKGYAIEIVEIPFGIQKSRLIEKLAELVLNKTIPFISDVRDESDEKISIIIKPRGKEIKSHELMMKLFQLTDLETNFSVNMNVLQDGKKRAPRILGLDEMIRQWLSHRHEILIKSNKYYLEKVQKRIHILEGLRVAYIHLTELIDIIRNVDEPKWNIMERFSLSEIQANSILDMKLRSLRKLEETMIERELSDLNSKRIKYEQILGSEKQQKKEIKTQLVSLRNIFNKDPFLSNLARRITKFKENERIENISNFVETYPATVVITNLGWIKAYNRHDLEINKINLKDGDVIQHILEVKSTSKLCFYTTNGKVYAVEVSKIKYLRKDFEPIAVYINLEKEERIISVLEHEKSAEVIMLKDKGKGMIVKQENLLSFTKNGKRIMNVANKESVMLAKKVEGDYIAMINGLGNLLVFSHRELNRMQKGSGVKFQDTKDSIVIDLITFDLDENIYLALKDKKSRKFKVKEITRYIGKRANQGKKIDKPVKDSLCFKK
tara:strand:+ start:11120 stop:13366 length:2247 start_codon:yes stop_codon:yes gene_type:complete